MVAALAVDVDLAGADLFEPGDHPQQGGLAAARRADEDGEGAFVDRKVDAVDHFERLEALPDIPEFDRSHHATVGCFRRELQGQRALPLPIARRFGKPMHAEAGDGDFRDVEAAAEHGRASVPSPLRISWPKPLPADQNSVKSPCSFGAKPMRPATRSALRPDQALTNCHADIERA